MGVIWIPLPNPYCSLGLNLDTILIFPELDIGTKCVVDMDNNQTVLYHPDAPFGEPPKKGRYVIAR